MPKDSGFKLFLANLFIHGNLSEADFRVLNIPKLETPEHTTENLYCAYCHKHIGVGFAECMTLPFVCLTCSRSGVNFYKLDRAFTEMKFALSMQHSIREVNALIEITKETVNE